MRLSIPQLPTLDLLTDLHRILSPWQELVWWPEVTTEAVAAVCRSGCMPMATTGEGLDELLIVKCHETRMLVAAGAHHVSRSTRRRASRYTLAVTGALDAVLGGLARYHTDSWVTPALASAWSTLAVRPVDGVQFVSIELSTNDGTLAAGEIGYLCGSVYTSITGWHGPSGSGSVQLALLGDILPAAGVRLWDLGMPVAYKSDLGAEEVERPLWVERYRAAAAIARTPGAPDPFALPGAITPS